MSWCVSRSVSWQRGLDRLGGTCAPAEKALEIGNDLLDSIETRTNLQYGVREPSGEDVGASWFAASAAPQIGPGRGTFSGPTLTRLPGAGERSYDGSS